MAVTCTNFIVPGTNAQQLFRLGDEVDATMLNRKLLMGYQGWFACPQDGSSLNSWVHWLRMLGVSGRER